MFIQFDAWIPPCWIAKDDGSDIWNGTLGADDGQPVPVSPPDSPHADCPDDSEPEDHMESKKDLMSHDEDDHVPPKAPLLGKVPPQNIYVIPWLVH